jgi:H+/Cl- antiporter ClcA
MSRLREANVTVEHIAGPLVLALVATMYNKMARHASRPTISTSIRRLTTTSLGMIVICGTVGALLGHWFLDESGKS